MLPANSSVAEISLNEIEGERDSTNDFVFVRIGSSIPISSSSLSFDFQSPPSQPLSISNRHGLLFISHPQQGFLVVKTNDVIAASREIKEDNSKELKVDDVCVMDVKIGSVEILAVSDDEDESLLAAAVGNEIFVYKVVSLLNKMQEPAFSSSLSNSATVKDFKWQKKMRDTSFVVLSTHGSLYHSTSEAKLNKIMDGVDAVDWSREGDYIAVARKHSISILSSDFNGILNMSLICESWQTLTDPGGTIIVDSIKWLLDDSIILGCHQVDEDGAEEGYLIQVIKSQKKNFSEMTCNPIVFSFSDLFDGVWDILPSGSGPYLLANYLDHWGAVLMSNKKAIDQHISLLKWSSMDDNNKVVALELISDKYTPKIEVPVNGDDNLVFGFCIGTVSTYEKINIKVDENVHELSPRYALFCLTSEGKLTLFHAARISEPLDLHQTLPHLDDSDLVERQFNTNFLNESMAKPDLNGIQIPTSKDLPKQINMESPNLQKGTFELPGNTISPHKQQVGTFAGQTGKFNSLFSDTVNSGDVESSVVNKGALASTSHGGATVSYFGSESTNKTHRDNQNEAHQQSNSSIFHPSSQLASSKDFSVNSQPSTLSGKSSYKSSVVSKGAFASSSHDVSTVSYFGSESTNNKTYRDNQNKAHQQSNSSIFHPSNQLASGRDFSVISQPSTCSEKSSYKNKENLGNSSLSMTGDANNSHTLQGSDVAEHEDPLHGKLDMSTAQSLFERIRASKSQDNTKQFYNVKDMTEELDILLSYIEKEGGFKDVCTSYQENSIHALEDGLWHLSERSQNCKKSIEEQLMDIQQLQNKIMQVSARQSYMKGIVEQASNKTYWDIWNRQKLNPELEVKQQNILDANQNLTREIIELERHFNTLEINKFGDVGRSTLDHAAFRRSQASLRQKPSLQSLYNTVNSQLSAAEQLSECLSKQMSDLNINLGSVEKKSITQKLFESIGLSCEHNSFQSPPVCKSDSLLPNSIRRTPLSATNSLKGYNQNNSLSLIKASEPETARRRRDSLDRNWTTFKPPKTTVKRATPEKFSRVDKDVPFRKAKESFDLKKKDFATHQKRVQDSRYKQQVEVGSNVIPRWTNDTSGSRSIESNSNLVVGMQRTFTLSPSLSHSFSTSSGTKNSTKNSYGTPKTSSTETTLTRNPANPLFVNINSNTKNYSQTQNIFGQTQSSANFSSNNSSINDRTITESRAQTSKNLEDSFSSSTKDSNSSLSTTPAFASNFSINIPAASQPNGPKPTNLDSPFKLPISTSFSTPGSVSTTATTAPLTSSSMTSTSFGSSLFSEKFGDPTSTLASTSLSTHPISSSPSSSSSSSTTSSSFPLSASSSLSLFPSASSFGQPLLSAFTSSSIAPVSTTTTKPRPSAVSSESEPASPKSVTSKEVETSVPNSSSGSLPTNNTNGPSFVSLSQPVASSSTSMPSSTEDKGKPSDANLSDQEEDGMEEEAPDTTSGFNLGSLSRIGLGSTMSSTPPKQNPFGGSFLTASSSNQSSMSSPFALQTSPGQGELFRPASFTIPSAQPTQPSSQGAFSGFGQTSRIGVGQQALGNVLGSFGASRQIGAGIVQNNGPSSASNVINSGFGVTAPAAAGGGFASAAVKVGGFAAVASGGGGGFGAFGSGGGFAGAGSGGACSGAGFGGTGSNASSGFGFTAANNAGATNNTGGGFGAAGAASGFKSDGFGGFGNNQGGSGGGMFSSFGGNNASSGTGKPPASLLTQMRK